MLFVKAEPGCFSVEVQNRQVKFCFTKSEVISLIPAGKAVKFTESSPGIGAASWVYSGITVLQLFLLRKCGAALYFPPKRSISSFHSSSDGMCHPLGARPRASFTAYQLYSFP